MCIFPFLYTRKKKDFKFYKISHNKIKPQNQNKALFFDVRVAMKERSTTRCLKRANIFHLVLVGLPTRLILFVKGLLTNDLNFLTGFVS